MGAEEKDWATAASPKTAAMMMMGEGAHAPPWQHSPASHADGDNAYALLAALRRYLPSNEAAAYEAARTSARAGASAATTATSRTESLQGQHRLPPPRLLLRPQARPAARHRGHGGCSRARLPCCAGLPGIPKTPARQLRGKKTAPLPLPLPPSLVSGKVGASADDSFVSADAASDYFIVSEDTKTARRRRCRQRQDERGRRRGGGVPARQSRDRVHDRYRLSTARVAASAGGRPPPPIPRRVMAVSAATNRFVAAVDGSNRRYKSICSGGYFEPPPQATDF
ncbi:hypothetical protein EJB05_47074, partial [Eragrostis curvula]